MKHYWINIDRCVERREFMEKQFMDNGIMNERISAATPETIKDYKFIYHKDTKSSQFEIACLVSHLNALEKGYESGDEYFCVMEDDVFMCKVNFDKMFKYIREAEDRDDVEVEIVQLHTNSNVLLIQSFNDHVMKEDCKFIVKRVEGYPSTGYYLVSRKGAKKLLDMFKIGDKEYDFSYSLWTAADNMLYSPINAYYLTYPIVTTDIRLGSMIHPSHLRNHEDSNVVIRDIHQRFNLMHLFV